MTNNGETLLSKKIENNDPKKGNHKLPFKLLQGFKNKHL
jgi:hypothetical protein